MKKFALSLIVFVFSMVSAFGQTPPSAPVPTTSPRLVCDGDLLYVSAQGSVFELSNPKSGRVSTNLVLSTDNSGGVQRVLPTADGFYAVGYNKVRKFHADGTTESWRMFTDGLAYDPDPITTTDKGWYQENSLSFRFPYQSEDHKVFLYGRGSYYNWDRTEDQPKNLSYRCASVVVSGVGEFCHDVKQGSIFQPTPSAFSSPRYEYGTDWFENQNPVAMAAGADGRLYVALGTTYFFGPNGTQVTNLGRLAVIGTARNGQLVEQQGVSGLDISSDLWNTRLSAGKMGIYLIVRRAPTKGDGYGFDEVVFYDYTSKTTTSIARGIDNDFLSGLAVAPAAGNAPVNNGSIGKGLTTAP